MTLHSDHLTPTSKVFTQPDHVVLGMEPTPKKGPTQAKSMQWGSKLHSICIFVGGQCKT